MTEKYDFKLKKKGGGKISKVRKNWTIIQEKKRRKNWTKIVGVWGRTECRKHTVVI